MNPFGAAGRRAKRNLLRVRDGDNCWLCGEPMRFAKGDGLHPEFATLDHVVPKSKGGTRLLSNLRLAHGRCNKVRGNAIAIEARQGGNGEAGSMRSTKARAEGIAPNSSERKG